MQEALCYDDVLIRPADFSIVNTRSIANLSMTLGNPNNPEAWLTLGFPIMVAPMEYISSVKIINAIKSEGGLGFVQRHQEEEQKFKQYSELTNGSGFSINLFQANNSEFVKKLVDLNVKVILIDTALGHTDVAINAVKNLRKNVPNSTHIISGNVSSYAAYKALMDAGADSVRVGIGGGAACMTRIKTGFGFPVLSSVMEIYEKVKDDKVNGIIADGGINNNGDIVKAFVAGARSVMMGSLFAGHKECDGAPGAFRGLASEGIQIKMGRENPYSEGEEGKVMLKGNVMDTIKDIKNSISSGCSYGGVVNLSDLSKNVQFIKVSRSTMLESNHRLEK